MASSSFKEGYEYVLMIAAIAVAVSILGPGRYSFDHAIGLDAHYPFYGIWGFVVSVVLGVGGAVALLVTSWTPPSKTSQT